MSVIRGVREGPRRVSVPVIATLATFPLSPCPSPAPPAAARAALIPPGPAPPAARGALWEAEGTMADGEEP